MAHKTFKLVLFVVLLLLLQYEVDLAVALRPLGIHPPATPRSLKPRPPPIYWYRVNRHKLMEDAFRPTSPGHSPGVGHDKPPPIL
ncbi:hypothetical protein K2173_019314 [Erythroxylum novogranatense]|uniref:Uncharacterized protein n=1 Tax=Erythroxylum novogranatense TaxID=1862640 RepID=A0AAV8STB1_9ROSI|nr:hypothetical protein K2173_019314 [Erythroxylum novogranatense]